jgi:Family of unknown function (DUF6283)
MSKCSKQKSTACNSCPWTKSNPEYYFAPVALKKSIVDSHKKELLHSCHSNHENFCTGYLSYAEQNLPNGLLDLRLGRLAIEWKIVDRSLIPQLEVFASSEKMIRSHEHRHKMFSAEAQT